MRPQNSLLSVGSLDVPYVGGHLARERIQKLSNFIRLEIMNFDGIASIHSHVSPRANSGLKRQDTDPAESARYFIFNTATRRRSRRCCIPKISKTPMLQGFHPSLKPLLAAYGMNNWRFIDNNPGNICRQFAKAYIHRKSIAVSRTRPEIYNLSDYAIFCMAIS